MYLARPTGKERGEGGEVKLIALNKCDITSAVRSMSIQRMELFLLCQSDLCIMLACLYSSVPILTVGVLATADSILHINSLHSIDSGAQEVVRSRPEK